MTVRALSAYIRDSFFQRARDLEMADARFPSPGVDARFPEPGVDARFPGPVGYDARFYAPGEDGRFNGNGYGGGGAPSEETFTVTFTDDQLLAIGPVAVKSITRVSGSPVTVSLYDSAFSATGVALFSQSMTALDVESLDLEFINGVYAGVVGGLGSELVQNGTFDTDVAGWTAQLSGVTVDWVSPGRLRLTTTTGGGRATQLVSGLTIGQDYEFTGDIPAVTGAGGQSANVRLTTDAAGGTTGQVYQGTAVFTGSSGSWSTTFTAASTSITVALLAGTGIAAQFDNVSLRQVSGGAPDGSFELELAA